jgi:hypothetical protein
LRCLICNEPIASEGCGLWWTRSYDAASREVPPVLVIHESCAREVADPSFDWDAVEEGRHALQAMLDRLPHRMPPER